MVGVDRNGKNIVGVDRNGKTQLESTGVGKE